MQLRRPNPLASCRDVKDAAGQLDWFNELCLRSTDGETAARLFEARAVMDVTELLPKVRTPTLILHARDGEVVQIEEGRLLATAIPGAEFIELDLRNHVLLENDPAGKGSRGE